MFSLIFREISLICLISETNYINNHLGYCTERPEEKNNVVIQNRYSELHNIREGILHFEEWSIFLRQLLPTQI